jgi:capsular polysaccharide biosynthesis protein
MKRDTKQKMRIKLFIALVNVVSTKMHGIIQFCVPKAYKSGTTLLVSKPTVAFLSLG